MSKKKNKNLWNEKSIIPGIKTEEEIKAEKEKRLKLLSQWNKKPE